MEDLIFVTAQPDVPYFHWQVRIYVHNFISLGINPNQIHVIFAMVMGNKEPTKESLDLKELGINVHHYLDERHKKHYIPNIKPFLIYKWLEQYPQCGKLFFLHDADIIFRKLPDFNSLIKDNTIYVSDTIGYIGHDYLKSCSERYEMKYPTLEKDSLLTKMVDVVGIDINTLKINQNNSGGGQYIIKNTPSSEWYKIYMDCVPLYNTMMDYHKEFPIDFGAIQFWTAEMWSLLWNLWYFKCDVKISDELSFSWATDDIRKYDQHNILHMAGVTDDLKHNKFYKGEYINVNPLDKLKENPNFFDYVDKNSSTIKYIDIMKSLVENND